LDGFDGVSPAHGRFYLLQSRLFKATGDTAEYYRSALKYLGCTPLNDVSIAEQRDHAKCLSLAALISDGIYNFGELVSFDMRQKVRYNLQAMIDRFLFLNISARPSYTKDVDKDSR